MMSRLFVMLDEELEEEEYSGDSESSPIEETSPFEELLM
jgi:hypothetical protein